jgi:hypothetical protein
LLSILRRRKSGLASSGNAAAKQPKVFCFFFSKKKFLPQENHPVLDVTVGAEAALAQAWILPVRTGAIPLEHAAAAAAGGFTAAAGTACVLLGGERHIVLAGLGESAAPLDAEAAGAAGMAAALRVRRVALDARGLAPAAAAAFALGTRRPTAHPWMRTRRGCARSTW